MERQRKYEIFVFIIAIALLVSAFRLYWDEELGGLLADNCLIEHGDSRCIDGFLYIPFHNPNRRGITSIKITVPFGTDVDMDLPAELNVMQGLSRDEVEVLKLFECDEDVDISWFVVDWCCGEECHRRKLNTPDDLINMEVRQ